jgi:hypothetical protein
MKTVSLYLKAQLTVMRVSTVAVYALGGFLYDYLGVTGVATFGAIILFMQLGSLVAMIHLEKVTGRDNHVSSTATDAASAAAENAANYPLSPSVDSNRGGISRAAIIAAIHEPGSESSNSSSQSWLDLDSSSNGPLGNGSFRSLVTSELATIEEVRNESGNFATDYDDENESDEEQPRAPAQQDNTSNDAEPPSQVGTGDPLLGRLQTTRLPHEDVGVPSPISPRTQQDSASGRFRESAARLGRIDLVRGRSFKNFGRRSRPRPVRTPSALLGSFTTQDIPIGWIDHFVAFAVSFQSILNGFVFGTGTLLMFKEYGQSKSLIGVIYSCSAVSGVLASLLPMNQTFVTFMRNRLPSPLNFYFFLFACTYMTLLTAIPNFAAFLVGFLAMNLALGLFVSYLTELQGKISTTQNYQKLAPYGQVCRRLSGLGIMFVSPILYDIMPRLPNIVGACTCFLFTLAIYIGFETAKGKSQDELAARLGQENVYRDGSTLYVTTGPGRANRNRRISFSEQIIMSSVLAGGERDEQSSLMDDSTVAMQVNYARRESMIENNLS